MHYVTVGEDESVGRKDEPRSMPESLAWDAWLRGLLPLGRLMNFEVEDGATDLFCGADYGTRISVQKFVVRRRCDRGYNSGGRGGSNIQYIL